MFVVYAFLFVLSYGIYGYYISVDIVCRHYVDYKINYTFKPYEPVEQKQSTYG